MTEDVAYRVKLPRSSGSIFVFVPLVTQMWGEAERYNQATQLVNSLIRETLSLDQQPIYRLALDVVMA